jgi:dihydrofolate synthase / folylpolyglutamate synthase
MRAVKNIPGNLPDSETRHPIFTARLLEGAGNPDRIQHNILITGSKGKGSVSRMIAKLLEVHGYRVGLFTSPHLINFNERIRINGVAISDEELFKYANIIEPHFMEIERSLPDNIYIGPVGIAAVMAILYFRDNKTDFNIIECGKGARYDDVSTIRSEWAVINMIFLEHMPTLGKNLSEIAYNKAGIIKNGQKCVFTAKQQKGVMKIIEEECLKSETVLKKYGQDFSCRNISVTGNGTFFDIVTGAKTYKDLRLALLGRHQAFNAALAAGAAENMIGNLNINLVKECFKNLTWPGRLEILNYRPLTILDGCINRECAKYVKEVVEGINIDPVVTIVGIPDDKDFAGVIKEFSEISHTIILTRTKNQYLKFTGNQFDTVKKIIGDKLMFSDGIEEAIKKAYDILDGAGMLCILGTQSLIKDTKEYFKQDTLSL